MPASRPYFEDPPFRAERWFQDGKVRSMRLVHEMGPFVGDEKPYLQIFSWTVTLQQEASRSAASTTSEEP